MTIFDSIIAYEQGELTDSQTLHLFGTLIKTGMLNYLQGHYGRTADDLVKAGLLDMKGRVKRNRGTR